MPSVKMPKSRLRRKLKLLARNGIIDMNFFELKKVRHKREKKHKNLQKIGKCPNFSSNDSREVNSFRRCCHGGIDRFVTPFTNGKITLEPPFP